MDKPTATTVFESLSSGITARRLPPCWSGWDGRSGRWRDRDDSGHPADQSVLSPESARPGRPGQGEQEGRYRRYRANLPLMLDLIAYLTESAGGHPEQCESLAQESRCRPDVLPPLGASKP